MSQRGVRVVVGEGRSTRRGLLRFVLEGEGYEVVGQAATSGELARILAVEKPDAVILDDGIGATAVQVAREASPTSKVVLVWPPGVVPVGGDASVEPGQVLRQLGPAVAALTIGLAPRQEGSKQPEWVARVRKDKSALRDRLERARLASAAAAGAAAAAAAAPLVILPGEAAAAAEPTLVLPDQGAAASGSAAAGTAAAVGAGAMAAAAVSPGPGIVARNQALGNLALGGAAVVGALALSLAIVGGRIPAEVVDVSGPSLAPSTGASPPLTPSPSPSASGSGGTDGPSVTGGGPNGGGTPPGSGSTGGTSGGGTTTPTYPPPMSPTSSHTPAPPTPPPTYPPTPTGSSPTEPPEPTYPPSPSALAAVPAIGILTFVAERRRDGAAAARHHHKR